MGEDVTRPQQVEDLRHQLADFDAANVTHDLRWRSGLLAREDRALGRFGPVFGNDILRHTNFDAECNIRVLTDRLGAGVHLREIDVIELRDGKRRQPDIGDMHEGVEPGAGLPDNEASEGGEIVCIGVARRNTCRGALIDHGFVGRKADG